MWPFKKKQTEQDIVLEAIDDLKAFRDVGEKFNYMGIEMIVESHYVVGIYDIYPRISAAYRNTAGELKYAKFTRCELPALKAENP